MILLGLFLLVTLVLILVISGLNALTFPRLRSGPAQQDAFVSVLIPARNEARVIGEGIRQWLRQDYEGYEILLLDDDSTDGTAEVARSAAGADERLRILAGEPLPAGWTGKNWACQQLAVQARGDVLLFTDADVHWAPGGLSAVMALYEKTNAALLTVWPTQRTGTWAERLVVPLMMFAVLGYLPEVFVRFLPWKVFAAANGQCLVFSRGAYEQLGGHRQVREDIVEDVGLARRAKGHNLPLVMALGDRLVSTRMYHGWSQVRLGFAKNILAGHGGRPFYLVLSTLFHWLLFVVPWLLLLLGWIGRPGPGWPWFPACLILLGLLSRAVTALVARQSLLAALLMPVSVLLMTLIAGQSLWWHFSAGGPQWKGRTIPIERRKTSRWQIR